MLFQSIILHLFFPTQSPKYPSAITLGEEDLCSSILLVTSAYLVYTSLSKSSGLYETRELLLPWVAVDLKKKNVKNNFIYTSKGLD